MIQGTTPTLVFWFPLEIETLKEFVITFEQEGKDDLEKTQADCFIDTENNVAYIKLTQEETRAFDTKKYVKIQVNAVTIDNNVITSDIINEHICLNIRKSNFNVEPSEVTPIDITHYELDFSNNSCGFNIGFSDTIVYKELPADKQLSSTSTNAVENRVVTENFARVDNELIKANQRADTIEEIAKGATVAKSFLTYADMVAELNVEPKTRYKVGQHFIIQTVGVPDLYVYGISNTSVSYTYTNDNAIVKATESGYVQIGYYQISQLETQKADLTEYAKKSQVPVINATLKENGAYTLTITMGVE